MGLERKEIQLIVELHLQVDDKEAKTALVKYMWKEETELRKT